MQNQSETPETDALIPQFLKGGEVPDIFALCRRLEQERDEARQFLRQTQELCQEYLDAKIKAENENKKLREIAEWFADSFVIECNPYLPHAFHELHDQDSLCPVIQKAEELRAELQLKEETK